MSNITEIKSRLENAIIADLDKGIENVNCAEMGAVIDMVKDLAEAEYHCAIVNAMDQSETDRLYYTPYKRAMTPEQYRDIEYATGGRMYYTETDVHADWVGKSGEKRKEYLEIRDNGNGTDKMLYLENYTKALTDDVTEMLQGASENEKQMIRTKMQMLAQKI